MDDKIGLERLEMVANLLSNDFVHIAREDEVNPVLLSYKSKIVSLDSLIVKNEEFNALRNSLNSLKARLETFVENFAKKQQVDAAYTSKEQKENVTPSFLTVQNFEQILEKYVTDLDLRDKENLDRKEATKMYDEMTDFAGAAMVGINQSQATPSDSTLTS